eukprot:gene6156-6863_t
MPAESERPHLDGKKLKDKDPAAKDKDSVNLALGQENLSFNHWNQKTRVKWTILLFIGCVLVYSVRTSMSIAVTSISNELGWNKQVSGMVLSSFFAGYVTTNILGGYLADRFLGERIMFYGAVLWATMNTIVPIVAKYADVFHMSNTAAVIAARFLTGVGQGMHFPSMTSIVTRRNTVVERSVVWGFAISGSAVGTVFSGFAGSFLIDQFGWPSLFLVTGIMTLLWLVIFKGFVTSTLVREEIIKRKSLKSTSQPDKVPWLLLFSKIPTWALLVVYFCNNFCFYNLLSWLPVYFHEMFPRSKGWVFNVVPWMSSFVTAIFAGLLSRKLLSYKFSVTFVRKLCTSIALFGAATFLLLLDSVETFEQALFLMTVILGVMSFSNVGPVQNAQDLAPKHAGSLYGVMNTAGALAGIVGVYVSGYLLETIGKWSAVFHLSSAGCFIGGVVFLLFGTGERIV